VTRTINSRDIEVFRAVMQTGTTTAAARILHATQPAISRTLSQFQWKTGLKLFDIQRSRLVPTPEAKELFDAVQRHFLGLEKVEETLSSLKHAGVGWLRVACTPVLGLAVLPEVVAAFQVDYPGVQISLHTISTPYMRDGLLSGLYDLALSTSDIKAVGLDPVVLHRDESVCVMNKDHPLAGKSAVHVRDLQHYPLLCHHKSDAQQQMLNSLMSKSGVEPPSVLETDYSATICRLAAAGNGIGIVSTYAATVFDSIIRAAPFSPAIVVETQLAFAPSTAPSKLALTFAEALKVNFEAWGKGGISKRHRQRR
jgi:DNA-binding transcriptional LysR family regulator